MLKEDDIEFKMIPVTPSLRKIHIQIYPNLLQYSASPSCHLRELVYFQIKYIFNCKCFHIYIIQAHGIIKSGLFHLLKVYNFQIAFSELAMLGMSSKGHKYHCLTIHAFTHCAIWTACVVIIFQEQVKE